MRIYNSVEHLRWSYFAEIVKDQKTLTIFAKFSLFLVLGQSTDLTWCQGLAVITNSTRHALCVSLNHFCDELEVSNGVILHRSF